MTVRERFWTIPNLLSLYRILIFPFILYLIIVERESLFALFITISLLTDILDGLIARVFNMQTMIGARLDSWADLGTYILAFLAIYIFKWNELEPHSFLLAVFAMAMFVSYLSVFLKFKSLIGLHTYMFKITGYVQGAFIVVLFVWGFSVWYYYFSISLGILACIEEILIILILSKPSSNVKGLYWVLKNERS